MTARSGARAPLLAVKTVVGLVALAFAGAAQVTVPTTNPPAPTTTEAPATTAAPTTAAPTQTTAPPVTTAPATSTTKRTTTTIAGTTTTPEQLPTLPPPPAGETPAPTETTLPPSLDISAARFSPWFPWLSIIGFGLALLLVIVQVILTRPSRRGGRTL